MNHRFNPDAIQAQIDNLLIERQRIDSAIAALGAALRSMEGSNPLQTELQIDIRKSDVTLHDAVKGVCSKLVDGITRKRVLTAIENQWPLLKPKSSSVAASLINLTKGETAMLKVAIEGKGRSPSFYSTEGEMTLELSADEIAVLMEEGVTKGAGGWQSLWQALQKQFDKEHGRITLSPNLRARIYHYYWSYGSGGWQNKALRVFRRQMPHLFAT